MGFFDAFKRLFGGSQGAGAKAVASQQPNAEYQFSSQLRYAISSRQKIETFLKNIHDMIMAAIAPNADARRIASDAGSIQTCLGNIVVECKNLAQYGDTMKDLRAAVFANKRDRDTARQLIDELITAAGHIPGRLHNLARDLPTVRTSETGASEKLSSHLAELRNAQRLLSNTKNADEALAGLVNRNFQTDHRIGRLSLAHA